jgi:hypothetical protein
LEQSQLFFSDLFARRPLRAEGLPGALRF